jgi:hypothetical protein
MNTEYGGEKLGNNRNEKGGACQENCLHNSQGICHSFYCGCGQDATALHQIRGYGKSWVVKAQMRHKHSVSHA